MNWEGGCQIVMATITLPFLREGSCPQLLDIYNIALFERKKKEEVIMR